jgi:endoglucanase
MFGDVSLATLDPVARHNLDRRGLLLALACFAAAPAWGQDVQLNAWDRWKAAYLSSDGRIVDDANGGISHSEGQAYGLLLAQAFGDRDTFARVESWTLTKLALRPDALLAWKWQEGGAVDTRNATDGDLLRAWALLRATRDSRWHEHEGKAAPICGDIARYCLAADPRAPQEMLLKPASHTTATDASVIINPSYYMIRALIELGDATGEIDLLRTAAHGERLLSAPEALRDWINVTSRGLQPAADLSANFGWDALRIPLYLFWSGRVAHPALRAASDRFAAATLQRHVATVTDPSGKLLAQSDASGFRAVADLAAGQAPAPPLSGQGYYADTLALLAQIAWREGI